MRGFNWLKRLRKSERGNVLVVGAATMPLLIGSAALAVDTVQMSIWKRQMQRSADSAAIAGAYSLNQDSAGERLETAVNNDLDENEHPILQTISAVAGNFSGFNRAVRVELSAQRSPTFINMFTSTPVTIRAEATAAIVATGEYCMISLFDGDEPGITANGNGTVTLGCGMGTNSRAEEAVTAGGSSEILATPIGAVGGLNGEGNNFVGETTLLPNSTPLSDPLAHVPNPSPNPSTCTTAFEDNPGQQTSIPANACYSSMNIKGTVTLNGPVYVYGGDMRINSQATVNGVNSTVILTGPNGQAGTLDINGGAAINLTAPETGDFAGVVLYRDRRAAVAEIRLNGGAELNLQGAMYFPTTDITILGNFELTAQCLQMVGRILNFQGTADIQNNCPANSASGPFSVNIVRLVA